MGGGIVILGRNGLRLLCPTGLPGCTWGSELFGVGQGRLMNFLNPGTVSSCWLSSVVVSCLALFLSPPKNHRTGGLLSLSFSGLLVEFFTLSSFVKLDSDVTFLSISSALGDFAVEELKDVVVSNGSWGLSRSSEAGASLRISLTLGILLIGEDLSGDVTGLRVMTGGLLVVATELLVGATELLVVATDLLVVATEEAVDVGTVV